MKLTVFTPTYNRGFVIEKAYKSLQQQTCHDFEWLVVDNGSTDNTKELFDEWSIKEKRFKIRYIKERQIGLPRALNCGLNNTKADYFITLDSDDKFMPEAVEKMLARIEDIDDDDEIVGVGIARCFPNGEYMKGVPPIVNDDGFVDATNLERCEYNLDADMVEAYKVKIFKQYPYKVWETEAYAPLEISLNEMALAGYKVRWYAERLYECDYGADGITRNKMALIKNNPMGFAMLYNYKLKYGYNIKKSYHAACQHIALSIVGKNPSYILKSNARLMTFFALPVGLVLSIRRLHQFRNVK